MRFPFSYKVDKETFHGNLDEELCCEAATYVWIQEKCPDVPAAFAFGGLTSNVFQGNTGWSYPDSTCGVPSLVHNVGWLAHKLASANLRGPTLLRQLDAAGVG